MNAQKDGRKVACIQFPDDDHIEVAGYRHQLYCQNDAIIFDFYTLKEDSELGNGDKIINNCTNCQNTLINFECAIKDRKSTRLNSSHSQQSRMPSSA